MKYLTAAVVLAGALASADASATMFDFSYSFSNGGVLTGSLDGVLDGSLIENVSNVHLTFAGLAYDQPLFAGSVVPPQTITFGNPVVSLDPTKNDFVFANAQSLDASQFFIFVGALGIVEAQGPLGGALDAPNPQSWSIHPVPLPAAGWLLASGAGFLGAMRRRKASTQSASAA